MPNSTPLVDQLDLLIRSRTPILWIRSLEEQRVETLLEQVCRRLACDSNTVYRLIDAGELDAVNIGAGSQNATWRIYRYSLIWFLFRREFVQAGSDTRPAALANIGRDLAKRLEVLAEEVRRGIKL